MTLEIYVLNTDTSTDTAMKHTYHDQHGLKCKYSLFVPAGAEAPLAVLKSLPSFPGFL